MFRATLETDPRLAFDSVRETGCALLAPEGLAKVASDLSSLRDSWRTLPPDEHLRDGGHYRFRRHSSFVLEEGGELVMVPHRAHYQPLDYNALHGGIERWFAPMEAETVEAPSFRALLSGLGLSLFALRPSARWFIEAHQFRIDATSGIGRPTPEGAHRDGVDYVAVSLVGRANVKGGETRVFEAEGPHGIRFTMAEPWTTLLLDDARVVHETSPVQPLATGAEAFRDTLVLTFRSGGFQAKT